MSRTFKTSEKNRTTYTYRFATGETVTITSEDVGDEWIAVLHADDDLKVDAERRERYHTPYILDTATADGIADTASAPLESLIEGMENLRHEELLDKLKSAMQTLQPRQIELVRKVYYERRTNVSIAIEEGVTEAAIRKRLKKIYAALRKELVTT